MNQITKDGYNTEQEEEIDLLDLFGFYLSRLPLLIIGLVVGAVIFGAWTHFMIDDTYTATSRMYMVSASSDSVLNISDLNLGTSLSNDYVELMKSRPVIEDVIEALGLDMTYEQVVGMVNLSVVNNTRIVKISVTTTDPKLSMDISNQIAMTSKAQLPKVMEAPSPTIAEYAILPPYKSGPSLKKNALIGGLLGLVIVGVFLTIIYMMDDTIKSSEDVERLYGVLPLSVIPEGEIEGLSNNDSVVRGHRHRRKKKKTSGGDES